MEPIRRTNMPRPRSGLSEIAQFDFDNASILRGGARRRADTNSSGSASQHNTPKRSNPFNLSFASGPAKALSSIFSNKRRKKHHTSAGPEYGVIPDNQARSFKTVTTSKDAEEVRLHAAQASGKEPSPPGQYSIFTFGQQQPARATQTQFTFGLPPQPQAQSQALNRPGKMKQAQRGIAETARQMFKPSHSKKDSKDLTRDFDPRLNGDVEITTSAYGPLQQGNSNSHSDDQSLDTHNKFFDSVRQAGSMLAGKRKDATERDRSRSRSRKRARDQSDRRDIDPSDEVPPIPPGFIARTTSISVDTHVGLEAPEYNVPPPHVYQLQQQQPPAPVPVMPEYHPYMTGQYFQTAYQNFYDPHAMMHAFGQQATNLAQHQAHQLPPIVEDETAEKAEEEMELAGEIDDKYSAVPFPVQQPSRPEAEQALHDEGISSGDLASHQDEVHDDEQRSPSQDQFRTPRTHHSSIHEVSSMDEDYDGTRSPVSSLSVSDAEMADGTDDELSRKDRLSLAASQRATAELDSERERLRQQFEQFSWCHGQEEEFGAYTLAADRESTFLN